MNDWDLDYISLSLRLNKHVPGYVDSYLGPRDLSASIERESLLPASQLVDSAESLLRRLPGLPYEPRRKEYLQKQVMAILTTTLKLTGQEFSYADEVALCFDIHPQRIDEAVFEEAAEVLDKLLPAGDALHERLAAWQRRFEIAPEKILSLVEIVRAEVRKRTLAFLDLPEEENLEIELVKNQPWSAYNWYKGGYKSHIGINTDLPVAVNDLTILLCHEAYPGHHTEHIIHERDLYIKKDYGEYAVALINTPECVISEGIGNIASLIIFEREELYRWQAEHLYPLAGVVEDPIKEFQIKQALRALQGVRGNAAFLCHEDGLPAEETIAYIKLFGLRTPERAQQDYKFISSPLWRAYAFTYFYGEDMLRNTLLRGDKHDIFRRLLTEHVYPSLIESGHWD